MVKCPNLAEPELNRDGFFTKFLLKKQEIERLGIIVPGLTR
jgi:hypothetical protein